MNSQLLPQAVTSDQSSDRTGTQNAPAHYTSTPPVGSDRLNVKNS